MSGLFSCRQQQISCTKNIRKTRSVGCLSTKDLIYLNPTYRKTKSKKQFIVKGLPQGRPFQNAILWVDLFGFRFRFGFCITDFFFYLSKRVDLHFNFGKYRGFQINAHFRFTQGFNRHIEFYGIFGNFVTHFR